MSEENTPEKKWEGDLFPSQKVREWSKNLAQVKDENKNTKPTGTQIPESSKKKDVPPVNFRNASNDPITPYIWENPESSKATQDKPSRSRGPISNPGQDMKINDKKIGQSVSPERIEDSHYGAVLPSSPVVDHDLPVPGSIMRNLLNTRMSGDLTKTLVVTDFDSDSNTLFTKEAAPTGSSTDISVSKMTDVMPQTLAFTPLAINKPEKRKKPLYSIFIATIVVLLLLGGLGTTFFMQQRTQGMPKQAKHPTPIIAFEDTTILSSPTPGSTATTRPGQTATPNPKATPSPVSTSQATPTVVPTQGVTPVPTKTTIPASIYKSSFEDGQLEGWAPRSSPSVYVQNSTNVARDGSHSLMVTFASSDNYPHISTTPTVNPPYKGQIVSGYVYVAAGSNVKGRMYILDQNMNGFIGGQDLVSLPAGSWYYLNYQIGSWAQGASTRIGFEFSGSNVVVYVDSVNW